MNIRRNGLKIATAFFLSLCMTPLVNAQEAFPQEPIQLIIPFAPGDTDKMLRPIVDRMRDALGQPVVMQYKPGAGGGVGASQVANAKADGYTLVGSSPGALVIVPLANKEFKYTTESFAPVAAFTKGAFLLLVPGDSPYKTLEDLVNEAKTKPGTITYGSSGTMGITHLLTEIFSKNANIELMHIPYQGSTPAVVDLLGKEINMATAAIAPALGYVKSGRLRALAVISDRRSALLPDVPTVAELGYGVSSPALYGIVAPKGTSKERVHAIYEAAKKAIEIHKDEINKNLTTLGAEIQLLDPEQYTAYLQEQKTMFSKAIDGLKVGPQ
ncbi:MAG: Bug family tripartite tricarboxylate transporter substrate binding protein [Advenella sp.]